MRLIDADELLNVLELGLKTMKCIDKDRCSDFIILESNIEQRENDIEIIKSMPTVEQKHGHWIGELKERWIYAKCSVCGKISDTSTPYCAYCGAKMRGDNDV